MSKAPRHNLPPAPAPWGDWLTKGIEDEVSRVRASNAEIRNDARATGSTLDSLSIRTAAITRLVGMYKYDLPDFNRTMPAGTIGDPAVVLESPTYSFNPLPGAATALVIVNFSAAAVTGVTPAGRVHIMANGDRGLDVFGNNTPFASNTDPVYISASITTTVSDSLDVKFGIERPQMPIASSIDFTGVTVFVAYYGSV